MKNIKRKVIFKSSSALGALLLKQTKDNYIEDYLIGKYESFNTECALSLGDVSQEILEEILNKMKQNLIQ